MRKIILVFFLKFIIINIAFSQTSIQEVERDSVFLLNYDPVKDLISDIDNLVNIPELFNANIGISIYSITKNQYVYNKNQNKNFIPASLVKLFTTYSALYFLNKNFRLYTELYANGIVNNKGVLLGDLVVQSNGNPYLNSNNYKQIFDDWIASLDSAGIKKINGNIVFDNSYFDDIYYPSGWAIDDIKYNYSAQISAINFNDNLVEFEIFSDGLIDELAQVQLVPDNDYIEYENNIKIVGDNSETLVEFDRDFTSNYITLKGNIKQSEYKNKSFIINCTVHNPTMYYANIFSEFLEDNDIKINGELIEHNFKENRFDYEKMNLMAMSEEIDIAKFIKHINSQSENLYAEILLKIIAKEKTGIGSTEKGIEQIKKLCEDIGIPSSGLKLFDGSGLSRMNLLSPIAIIRLLNYVAAQKDYNIFLNSLAKPNDLGTMKNRLKGSIAENKVWAKTGSMNFVNNIAGYVKTSDGELLSYAICFNNFTTPSSTIRNIQDLILMRLAAFDRKKK